MRRICQLSPRKCVLFCNVFLALASLMFCCCLAPSSSIRSGRRRLVCVRVSLGASSLLSGSGANSIALRTRPIGRHPGLSAQLASAQPATKYHFRSRSARRAHISPINQPRLRMELGQVEACDRRARSTHQRSWPSESAQLVRVRAWRPSRALAASRLGIAIREKRAQWPTARRPRATRALLYRRRGS